MDTMPVKVLLLGDDKVGKSTFLARTSQGSNALDGTVEITPLRNLDQPFIFEMRNRKHQYRLEFYDTSAPENWRLLEPDLVIICYDISQRLSLINMQRVWIKEVRANFKAEASLPVVVLGLKRDLRSEDDPNGIIYPQEAYRISQEIRADKYVECSAVTGDLLKLAFEEICSTAMKTTTLGGGQSDGGCVIM
ncbi:P-loop containing nucleoside triphosphate hydrolase protein [Pseudomassariella vexata]|uniref:p-loop containing nucleoside triphosphate hydrolase protein n=1 Tax=Pseudomassariella vexata TaxID=1141098 RepID=A0A1Y2D7J6_9PEZI|nr:P-loop containing nucleoside triphosphate hydrolase protein [Pseudomassariella vexata]ORY55086.1 P-loop containing nucleoside triphosphate hydrolase protein [Pseudomassariella vexata]